MRPVEGTLLGNRYKLTSRIAVGGMGEVWKGVDSVLGREVAAKILKDEFLSESTFLARFRAEAQNMGRVSDPGIAGVYDYGDEQGSPYLVMEYVPGEALSAIIERSAPLSETDTLSIVTQAAAALGAAHKVGVIHRDIKPGNILMTPDFRVKITDFGIARVTDQAPLTKTGQVMGTAQYLAPEQATGKGSGPGSDLYALGIIAYEALAGQRPFTGDSQVAIAIAQVNQQHPPLPDTVSEPLRRFVDCLLEKKPERRPSEAFKVAKAAEALSAGDIAGAEELVPQMRHGAAASEALTQVFNNPEPVATTKAIPVTSSNDATQVYPNGAGAGLVGAGAADAAANTDQFDPDDPQNQDPEKDKQSNKGRVLIWILAIVALLAVGSLLWFFLGGGNAEPEPEPSTSAPTSEAAKTIEIDKNDYIGLSESSATQNLENKGLEVETTDINSDRAAGTVADVGEGDNGYTFEEGDTVTLYVSAGPADEPEEPASDSGSDPGLGNDSETNSDSGSSSSSNSSSSSDSNADENGTGSDQDSSSGSDQSGGDNGDDNQSGSPNGGENGEQDADQNGGQDGQDGQDGGQDGSGSSTSTGSDEGETGDSGN
ncbi:MULTISPECIES: protein kinase domain-containing protein [unclassified Brevibacterium]|uniref:protein kinase domain-containing protein n=1 Tax=unclassified Brevibacterium TaxID=2614124 RepID=UPI001092069F|nr:protein kinase [Brevibacterium sp. S22]TGD32730.1 PASTA domain-containing protein [Brevibacterium sp. S22]